jgi:hypothetical protein
MRFTGSKMIILGKGRNKKNSFFVRPSLTTRHKVSAFQAQINLKPTLDYRVSNETGFASDAKQLDFSKLLI